MHLLRVTGDGETSKSWTVIMKPCRCTTDLLPSTDCDDCEPAYLFPDDMPRTSIRNVDETSRSQEDAPTSRRYTLCGVMLTYNWCVVFQLSALTHKFRNVWVENAAFQVGLP